MDEATWPRPGPSRLAAANEAVDRRLQAGAGSPNGRELSRASPAAASRAGIRVDRAVSELRRGRPVRLSAGSEQILVAAVETMLPHVWAGLGAEGGELNVTLTAERAQASGWYKQASVAVVADARAVPLSVAPVVPALAVGADAHAPAPLLPISLRLPGGFEPAKLADLAGLGSHNDGGSGGNAGDHPGGNPGGHGESDPAVARQGSQRWASLLAIQSAAPAAQTTPAMRAALELTRLARLVPAIVTLDLASVRLQSAERDSEHGDPEYLQVSAADVQAYPQDRASSLLRVSEAPVPLAGHENSHFVLFREAVADLEHVAIIIGSPDPAKPVLVRLHSSCLTGDLFASLRCDCGDQLRGGIDRLGEEGGILLYLAQEGRGIGLANKLRAYARQDAGLDTIDADRYLGFRGDERNFAVAAQMLQSLRITQIRLLTNNPYKIAALRQAGLDVVERQPIGGRLNRHNERYIATKRDRAGHLIDVSTLPAERHAG
jgi:GTP cyclohydrolase II